MRIAIWSGPRNLSTAMMYSFAARGDCAVWDEPFYGAYLDETGLDHPMREETLQAVETNPNVIADRHAGAIPEGKPHYYFKEMAHHMLPSTPRGWLTGVTHVFLIRHPSLVLNSYIAKREKPTDQDIGFVQQALIFDEITQLTGVEPAVVDASDVRAAPALTLSRLCDRIGLPYTDKMLSWPAGPHPDDGPWAPHWYGSVWKSTGFSSDQSQRPDLPDHLRPLHDTALPIYNRLKRLAI